MDRSCNGRSISIGTVQAKNAPAKSIVRWIKAIRFFMLIILQICAVIQGIPAGSYGSNRGIICPAVNNFLICTVVNKPDIRFFFIRIGIRYALGNAAGPLKSLILRRKVIGRLICNIIRIADRIRMDSSILIFKDLILQTIRNADQTAAGRNRQVIHLHVTVTGCGVYGDLRRAIRCKDTPVACTDHISCNKDLTRICGNTVHNQPLCGRIVIDPRCIDKLIRIFIVTRACLNDSISGIRQYRCVRNSRPVIAAVKRGDFIQGIRIQFCLVGRVAALNQTVQVHVMA